MSSSSSSSMLSTPSRRKTVDKTAIQETMKTCQLIMQSIADRIMDNEEKVDLPQIDQWKEELLNQYSALIRNKLMEQWMEETVTNSVTMARSQLTDGGNLDTLYDLVKKDVEGKKRQAEDVFDPSQSQEVKKIRQQLYPDENEDEDLLLMTQGNKKAQFLCPITQGIMNTPMKSTRCIHHMSQEALNMLLKNKSRAKCPVAGCNAEWTASTSSVDEDLLRQLKRYLRLEEARNKVLGENLSVPTQETVLLDED